jgi:thymidylate synthase (FAD)
MANDVVPAAEALLDVKVPILDHGFVMLDSYMGSDAAIARAARNCTSGENTKTSSDDRSLIRRLMSDRHTSPFEFVELKFLCRMPIFVARQWIRHRTANVNEMSGRFGQMPELVYVPDDEQIAYQDPKNKQGRGALASPAVAAKVKYMLQMNGEQAFADYHVFLGRKDHDCDGDTPFTTEEYEEIKANGGISRELARIDLPLSTYSQWTWKIDLHNLLHFLELRLDKHAQWEIRQYARAMAKVVEALCPIAWEAFVDYRLEAMTFSRTELELLRTIFATQHDPRISTCAQTLLSVSEIKKFQQKLKDLGLAVPDATLGLAAPQGA